MAHGWYWANRDPDFLETHACVGGGGGVAQEVFTQTKFYCLLAGHLEEEGGTVSQSVS